MSATPPAASVELRQLAPGERDAARALLAASALSVDDLTNPAISRFGSFDGPALVGVIGLEACDSVARIARVRRARGIDARVPSGR